MIWAKIVNNEIMQTYDENPAGLWHPDQIAKNDLPGYWEEVPDHVNVGWKFKNNEWISGGQWIEEEALENPPAPVGPPFAKVDFAPSDDPSSNTFQANFDARVGGIYDTWSITVGDTTYSTTATATNSTTNEITCGTTEWLAAGDLVTFMDALGGIEKHKTYIVHSVVSATKFKICDIGSSISIFELATDTGSVLLSKGPDFKQIFQKTDSPQPIEVSITATGPGGTTTYSLENEMALVIPEKWVPLFARP
jgi:hypothetical protein